MATLTSPWLHEWGFTQCESEPCVLAAERNIDGVRHPVILGCSVDNLCTLYAHDGPGSLYDIFTRDLAQRWNVEDEGPVSDLLNVDRKAANGCVRLSQHIHRDACRNVPPRWRVLSSFDASQAPASEGLLKHVEAALPSKADRALDVAVHREYMSLVRALLFCSTQTRPDIAYAVGMPCRAMSCPTALLLAGTRRVLMYLYHHRCSGLRYAILDHDDMHGYSDSDRATRHSTSGYIFCFGQAAISWASKKQPTVALFSCEAEIMAASEATKEASYLRALFAQLGVDSAQPTSLSMDNMTAIDLMHSGAS